MPRILVPEDPPDCPYCGALYAYWDRERGRSGWPSSRLLDPHRLPPLALDHISVVDVDLAAGTEPVFTYRIVGRAIVGAWGHDFTGERLDFGRLDGIGGYWHTHYLDFMARAEPMFGRIAHAWEGRPHLEQAWMKLPVACPDGGLEAILCCDVFRVEGRRLTF